jgi:hypothetical protein
LGIFEFEDPSRAAKVALNAAGEVVEPIVGAVPVLPHKWPELTPAQLHEANFGGQIKLIGFDPINQSVEPGANVSLTLYWETLDPPGQNLNLFVHLIDPVTQTRLAGFDAPPRYPTAFWQAGNTIVDSRLLSLPADLPPGDYEMYIGWYNLDDLARLPLQGENESGDAVRLFTLSVGRM